MDDGWLNEAKEAYELGYAHRTLDLINRNAFKSGAPSSQQVQAFEVARRIERGDWPSDVKQRAARLTRRFSSHTASLAAAAAGEKKLARIAARTDELEALGLKGRRVQALAQLKGGAYDVILTGLGSDHDRQAIRTVLADLGYSRAEIPLLLERVEHIAPEPIALRLHQSAAVRIKVALEAAGAKIRIKGHG